MTGGGSCGMLPMTGGGCSAGACAGPLVPHQPATQYGTGCGCAGSSGYTSLVPGIRGGKRGGKRTRGGKRGLLFANGGGCGCMAKVFNGGKRNIGRTLSNTRANVSSIANYKGIGGAQNIGRTLSNTQANVSSIANYKGIGGGCPVPDACPFPGTGACSDFYAKGGAAPIGDNGGFSRCGCLTNPRLLHGGGLISSLEQVLGKMNEFLTNYPPLNPGNVVLPPILQQIREDEDRIAEEASNIRTDYNMNAATDPQELELLEKLGATWDEVENRLEQYVQSGQEGGYKPTKRNLKYLKRYRQGKSIGFTMKASLKAKGLIPRTSRKNRGKKLLGKKYK